MNIENRINVLMKIVLIISKTKQQKGKNYLLTTFVSYRKVDKSKRREKRKFSNPNI